MSGSEDGGEAFDAFNDDTFGDLTSTWEEDTHEVLVAREAVEEEKIWKPGHHQGVVEDGMPHLERRFARGMNIPKPEQPQQQEFPWKLPPKEHQPQNRRRFPTQNRPHHPLDWQRHPQDRQHHPQDRQRHPQDRQHHPQDRQHFPQDRQHFPQDRQHFPQDRQHFPQDRQHFPQDRQHFPQDRQHHSHHHNHNNNGGNNRNSHYNHRNRETFGNEMVDAHIQTFRDQNQRYFRYHQNNPIPNNNNNNNNVSQKMSLITPDRVHALGILNRREDSTGDPELDMRRNVRHSFTKKENDEYSWFMTREEREWVLQIQLSQLKCENPFVDDYYFTVFNQKKNSGFIENKNIPKESLINSAQLKRTEEGPQLLMSEYSSSATDDSKAYSPVQFGNSLGKIQAMTVRAPRLAIDINVSNNDSQETTNNNAQKDSRKFKQTLLELEHLFSVVIEVEDSEKKLAALPTNTVVRNTVRNEQIEALEELDKRIAVESRVRRYLLVRKGKTLLARALRHLLGSKVHLVVSLLCSLLPVAIRRDRDDHLLPELLPHFVTHFKKSPSSDLLRYLKFLNCGDESPMVGSPTYKNVFGSSLGTTLIVLIVDQLKKNTNVDISDVLNELGEALDDTPIIVPPIKGYSNLGGLDPSKDPGLIREEMKILFS